MNLEALQAEFRARGFTYLGDTPAGITRMNRWLNQAYLDICEMDDWPFLSRTWTAAAPWTAETNYPLGTVEYVRDMTNLQVLNPIDVRDIIQTADIAETGTPKYFWFDGDTVKVWPVATPSLEVRYWYIPAELGAGESPLIPDRYQYAIIEFACSRAYIDTDNPTLAAICRQEGEKLVDQMRTRLLQRQIQQAEVISTFGFSEDS